MELNIPEVLRYLGVTNDPEGLISQQLSGLAEKLQCRITPRIRWRCFPLSDDSPLQLPSSALVRKMLADASHAAVMLVTLGAEFDIWVRREQARDMSRAVMLDALGSVYVEAACDQAEQDILTRFPGKFLTDRFSPGYGDFPLETQQLLMKLTGAGSIGVTLTDSLLLNPQKSVTAVVGIADTPQMARIRGCAFCTMNKTCTLRKAGTPCHV